jgi:hypothetical protein
VRNLNYELKQLCRRNRDGSFATQRDRERMLDLVATQLHDMGYRHMAAASLKPKHVERLVERWQAEALAVGTIKNRMAELRWWAEKIGKQNVIARDNNHYGIGNRQYVTNASKARELSGGELARITDPHGDVATAAGGLWAAPWRVDQDPPGVGRSRRQAGAQGHVDQGRPSARNPHPQR